MTTDVEDVDSLDTGRKRHWPPALRDKRCDVQNFEILQMEHAAWSKPSNEVATVNGKNLHSEVRGRIESVCQGVTIPTLVSRKRGSSALHG